MCGEFTGPRWIPRTKASDATKFDQRHFISDLSVKRSNINFSLLGIIIPNKWLSRLDLYPFPLLPGPIQYTHDTPSIIWNPTAETRRCYDRHISATRPSHSKTTSLHRIRPPDDRSTIKRFSLQIEMQLMSLKINRVVCNTRLEFLHSDLKSTGIILGVGPANGRRRNDIPHRPSPHPIWSLSRGVPITRPQVTRCFWQLCIYWPGNALNPRWAPHISTSRLSSG